MSKYLSQQKLWLDPTIEVLRNSQGKGRTLESLHGCDLLVLKDGHAEVRSLAVETGSAVHAGGIAMHLVHVAPSPGAGGYLDVSTDRWFLTENALARIEPNEFAPGAAEYQLDLSDDED